MCGLIPIHMQIYINMLKTFDEIKYFILGKMFNFNTKSDDESSRNFNYDYDSIMHYGSTFFRSILIYKIAFRPFLRLCVRPCVTPIFLPPPKGLKGQEMARKGRVGQERYRKERKVQGREIMGKVRAGESARKVRKGKESG